MFSQREDGDSKHSPAFCKGVGVLNRSSRRRGTSNRVRRSLSKFGFSEPPLTVRPWSHNQSDSTRSCARQETPSHTKSLPCQTDVDPGLFVARTGSSCALAAKDCSPIALSVVTSVSGLNKEIRRLTKCICRHNEVVADFRKALTTLAKIQNMEQQCDHGRRFRCPCWSGIPSKRRLRTEDFEADDPIAQETDRSQHHDPSYAPTLDGKFIMDHMPFRSKKLKRAPRTRQTARDKSQTKKNPNMVDLTGERGRQSGHPRRPRSKSPGRSNCIQKHYNYLAPVGSDGAVHESALLCMVADKIPKAFNLAFVPTRSMDLAGVELAVATYIFSKDLPKSEILADVGHCVADRTALLTLGPNERVMDDVITIVATMLSKTSSQHQWFMPTMIMQDALQGTSMTQANIDAVVSKHMRCKVDKVTERLMYFNFFKCTTETEARKLAMTQVALHLESLTIGPKWLSKSTAERPRFSSYPFEEPLVPQQHRKSMDCGVWVLQWMIRGALWAIHNVTAVNDQTRMRIALDLVLRLHNAKAIDIVKKAMSFWSKKVASSRRRRQR